MQRMLIVGLLLTVPVVAWQVRTPVEQAGPAPQVQNGRVLVRTGGDIAREIAGASAPGSVEPVWLAWRVPLIDGDRDLCGWYSDRLGTVRALFVDDTVVAAPEAGTERARPRIAPQTGPIPLEAGTGLVVLVRVVGGQVERLRTAGDDCPMDAGGRTVHWLSTVAADESLRFLVRLVDARADGTASDIERRAADTALRAIALHGGTGADALLERIAADAIDAAGRRQAAAALGAYRGSAGIDALIRLARTSQESAVRTEAVRALSQSADPRAAGLLEEIIKR